MIRSFQHIHTTEMETESLDGRRAKLIQVRMMHKTGCSLMETLITFIPETENSRKR